MRRTCLPCENAHVKVGDRHYRSLWAERPGGPVHIIDQTRLPYAFETRALDSPRGGRRGHRDDAGARRAAHRRDGGLRPRARHARDASDAALAKRCARLAATRPTAINLRWALERMRAALAALPPAAARGRRLCRGAGHRRRGRRDLPAIGGHGLALHRGRSRRASGRAVNILTHCNAGWLATVDWGTALAPIYMAHDAGIAVHVWVDETRPRNQGAALTAWELGAHGVPHTVVADNAGGHLMQHGEVDLVIVGTDRVTRTRRRRQQDRHLPEGARGARQRRARSTWRCRIPTIDWTLGDGVRGDPDRGAQRRRGAPT